MKRRRSDRPRRCRAALVAAALVVCATPAAVAAQATGEGAIFLLLPVGARAVATGGAVAAAGVGSENVWWNPATIARDTRGEVAIHHAQTVAATSDALVAVIPWQRFGVFAVAANLVDLFEQEVTPPDGGPAIGTFLPRNVVASLSFARALGGRLDVGATAKVLQVRLDCSGQCGTVPVDASTTTAADVGVRFSLDGWAPVAVGFALRNAGGGLRLGKGADREPLPTRYQAGVLYVVPGLDRYANGLEVRLSSDVSSPTRQADPGLRLGAEASWQHRVALRGGYVFEDGSDGGAGASGPTVGLGLVAGRLVVDIAREFQGLSVDAGQPPTYVTLRYRF
ncbi:MAG TPA: PorV/PorQ family protein [Gemmatimonadaceae bacterium]